VDAAATLDYLKPASRRQGKWSFALKATILQAVAQLHLRDINRALSELHEAYEISRENGIIAPFVECGRHMRRLIEEARKSDVFSFDDRWLDDIYRKSSTFVRRLSTLSAEYQKRETFVPRAAKKLSKRETDVLQNLSLGLTREEIANINRLSVNTVKSVIRSVYGKLGAVNRADAVRIANALGLLK
jgi:LuxR family maltose regulon positive regulatory protein